MIIISILSFILLLYCMFLSVVLLASLSLSLRNVLGLVRRTQHQSPSPRLAGTLSLLPALIACTALNFNSIETSADTTTSADNQIEHPQHQ